MTCLVGFLFNFICVWAFAFSLATLRISIIVQTWTDVLSLVALDPAGKELMVIS